MNTPTIAASHLLTPCTVLMGTRTADGAGGTTVVWTPRETTVCRIAKPNTAVDAAIAERVAGRTVYRYSLPLASTVTSDDRLSADSRTWEVLSVVRAPGSTLTQGYCAEAVA